MGKRALERVSYPDGWHSGQSSPRSPPRACRWLPARGRPGDAHQPDLSEEAHLLKGFTQQKKVLARVKQQQVMGKLGWLFWGEDIKEIPKVP